MGIPVAVTGANGFIGRRLVAALCARGAHVTALLRSQHGADVLQRMGAGTVIAPLRASPTLASALADQQVLFHFAYDMRASGPDNLAAFDALMAAAPGIPRIIHASSAVVYDRWPNGILNETCSITTGIGSGYRQAKVAMEARLLGGTTPAAILQPTIVYGTGSGLWTNAPMAALRGGGVVLPDPVGFCPAVHVDDVVQVALLAATLPDLGRERFLINGPDQPTWAEFYQGYAAIIGTGQVILQPYETLAARLGPALTPGPASGPGSGPSTAARISAALRRAVGNQRFEAAVARIRRLSGPTGPVYPDRSALILYAGHPVIDSGHARTRLGYAPAVSLQAGLAAIAAQL